MQHQLQQKNNLIKKIKWVVCLCTTLFIISCDFTPPINRKIIDAQNYITTQQYEKAAYLYEEILKNNISTDLRIKFSYQLGELYSIYLGKYKKAVYYYSEAKQLTEDTVWLIKIEEKLADINFNYLKNYSEAIKNYSKLSEIKPKLKNYDFFQYQIANSHFQQKQYQKAIEQLTIIQTNINNEYFVSSFYLLGLIYYEIKEYNKALFVWSEYLKREEKKEFIVKVKFLIANIYESTENLKMAYDIYYSIMNDYPNSDVIQARLKSLYERRVSRRR